jgi:hypothetical protein
MGVGIMARLQREGWVVLGCGLLYLILTFFAWQHFTVRIVTTIRYGFNEWEGVGVIAGGLVIALLAWEVARLFRVPRGVASISPQFVSFALAMLLLAFTALTFFSRSDGRQWPAWVGLALSIVIGAAAFARAKAEGIEMLRVTRTPVGSTRTDDHGPS